MVIRVWEGCYGHYMEEWEEGNNKNLQFRSEIGYILIVFFSEIYEISLHAILGRKIVSDRSGKSTPTVFSKFRNSS